MEAAAARARDLIGAADAAGLACRALGGIGVYLLCPDATAIAPLRREFNDLDLVTVHEDTDRLSRLLEGQAIVPERRFNLLHGDKRLLFHDPQTGRHLDVFVDSFQMCHQLALRGRLRLAQWSLSASDLLLTKLQIARITDKDIRDIAALVLERDAPVDPSWFDPEYIGGILGGDWGWWKTVTDNLAVVAAALPAIGLDGARLAAATGVLGQLGDLAADCAKSRRWRLRSRLGTRIGWREEPEEAQR